MEELYIKTWLELLCVLAVVVVMAKVARMEQRSPLLWGGLTVIAVLLTMRWVRWPYIRVVLGAAAVYALMMLAEVYRDRKNKGS